MMCLLEAQAIEAWERPHHIKMSEWTFQLLELLPYKKCNPGGLVYHFYKVSIVQNWEIKQVPSQDESEGKMLTFFSAIQVDLKSNFNL